MTPPPPIQGPFAVPEQPQAAGTAPPKFPEASVAQPINPMALNQSPAPIPGLGSTPVQQQMAASDLSMLGQQQQHQMPAITPTIAETGVPVSAGAAGPGPASGSLHDLKSPTTAAGGQAGTSNTGAAAVGQALNTGPDATVPTGQPGVAPPAVAEPKHESAEEEKKRLEREERERLLRQSTSGTHDDDGKKDEDLPPYQDF